MIILQHKSDKRGGGPIQEGSYTSQRPQRGRSYARRAAGQRRKKRRIKVSVIVALLLIGIVVSVIAVVSSGKTDNHVVVPDVYKLTYNQATAKLKSAHLNISIDDRQAGTDLAVSTKKIKDQTPSAGSAADKGSVVHVTLVDVPFTSEKASQPGTSPTTSPTTTPPVSPPDTGMVAPVDGQPLYPYTKDGSIACGHWPAGSTDYPYFGAPRENTRLHGAIDIYPPTGRGTPVKAIKDGAVVQVIPSFYTRADGEVCCGILIDHGNFVAYYGEMANPPSLSVGQTVKKGQQIGVVSGTVQLHFEMYRPGTKARTDWYGNQPSSLLDPTQFMLQLIGQ